MTAASVLVGLLALEPSRPGTDGAVAQRLAELSAAIARQPANPQLINRAELHRRVQDWESALADLEMAASLPGGFPRAAHQGIELLLMLRRPAEALQKAELVLRKEPRHHGALVGRARALSALGRPGEAAATWRQVNEQSARPSPDDVLEHARDLAAAGDEPEAVAVIDAGIARIGPVVSLHLAAVEYEAALRRWDAAAARFDALAGMGPRKDLWLRRKGELYLRARRPRLAQAAFREALASLDGLPPDARTSPLVKAAEAELRALVTRARGRGR